MELLTIALATFTAIVFVLGILPFRIPIRLMPLTVSAAGYGMDVAYQHYQAYVFGAAVAGGVVLITRYGVKENLPGPWIIDDFLGWLIEKTPKRPPRHRKGPWNGLMSHEDLPRGVGRRMPSL